MNIYTDRKKHDANREFFLQPKTRVFPSLDETQCTHQINLRSKSSILRVANQNQAGDS
jgi:hypothetical protein